MDKTTGKTYNKMERQLASVETVHGGVPSDGVIDTLVVNGKK